MRDSIFTRKGLVSIGVIILLIFTLQPIGIIYINDIENKDKSPGYVIRTTTPESSPSVFGTESSNPSTGEKTTLNTHLESSQTELFTSSSLTTTQELIEPASSHITITDRPNDPTYVAENTLSKEVTWTAQTALLVSPTQYTIFLNDTQDASGDWDENVPIPYDVAGLTNGFYTLRITLDSTSIEPPMSDEVSLQVYNGSSDPIVPEVVQNPGNITVAEGQAFTLEWNATDAYLDNFEIFKEEISVNASAIASGEIVSHSDSIASKGVYNYTFVGRDQAGNEVFDTAFVHVEDRTPPVFNTPTPVDTSYEAGTTGNTITWQVSTEEFPHKYQAFANGSSISFGTYSVGQDITVNIDGLSFGTYNITMKVNDTSGNYATDMVYVDVTDNDTPIVTQPNDIAIQISSNPFPIQWNATDFSPDNYTLYTNNSIILEEGFWTTDTFTFVTTTGLDLGLGVHNLTIIFADDKGQTVQDTVFVTIYDDVSPEISVISSEVPQSSENAQLWTIGDHLPANFSIQLNSEPYDSGTYTNTTYFGIDVTRLELGQYNFTIMANDTSGNVSYKILFVTVIDVTAPSYSEIPSNSTYSLSQDNNPIAWGFTDRNGGNWTLLINSSSYLTGDWNDPLLFDPDDLAPGIYNLTTIIQDSSKNSDTHTIWIIVVLDEFEVELEEPIKDEVSQGAVQMVDLSLVGKFSRIPNGTIVHYQIVGASSILFTNQSISGTSIHTLFLDYTGLPSGTYQWKIDIMGYGFDNITLSYSVEVQPPKIRVEVVNNSTFVKSEPYELNITLFFDEEIPESSLTLSSYLPKQGRVVNTDVKVVLVIIIDGQRSTLNFSKTTDEFGTIVLSLTPDQTREIDDIREILVEIQDGDSESANSVIIPDQYIPRVVTQREKMIDELQRFVLENLVLVLVVFLSSVIVVGMSILRLLKRRRERIALENRNKDALALLDGLKSIRVIILQHNTGTTYFKLNLVKLGVDSNLIGGLTSAVSSFMSEVADSESSGFEKVEREGLTILSHRSSYSAVVLVLDKEIPEVMYDKLREAHLLAENTFQQRLSADNGLQINQEEMLPILHEGGLPIGLVGKLLMRHSEFERVRGSLVYEEDVRDALLNLQPLFSKNPEGLLIEQIIDYLVDSGKSRGYAAYTLISAFRENHLVIVSDTMEGVRTRGVLDEAEEPEQLPGEVTDPDSIHEVEIENIIEDETEYHELSGGMSTVDIDFTSVHELNDPNKNTGNMYSPTGEIYPSSISEDNDERDKPKELSEEEFDRMLGDVDSLMD